MGTRESVTAHDQESFDSANAQSVCLLISSLAGGGAEKVMAQLANSLVDAGKKVTLVTWDEAENDLYSLSQEVKRIGLGLLQESHSFWRAIQNNRERIKKLKQTLSEISPGVMLSFQTEMNVIAIAARKAVPGCRCYISERSHPELNPIGKQWKLLRRLYYPKADGLVVQTEGARQLLKQIAPRAQMAVIPNGIEYNETSVPSENREKQICSVMRLSREKGPHLLIDAFREIAVQLPGWRLKILGEGRLRDELESKIEQSGLEKQISLTGWKEDVRSELERSSFFVLPSSFEGFPNAALEAMVCGLPVIAFDCEFGPRELINPGVNGELVPVGEVQLLAEKIRELALNSDRCRQWGQAARKTAQQYDWSLIFDRWLDVLER